MEKSALQNNTHTDKHDDYRMPQGSTHRGINNSLLFINCPSSRHQHTCALTLFVKVVCMFDNSHLGLSTSTVIDNSKYSIGTNIFLYNV